MNDPMFGEGAYLAKHANISSRLIKLIESLPVFVGDERYKLVSPIVIAISNDLKAINLLCTSGLGQESPPLIRMVIERLITFYYLLECDEKEIGNYVDFAVQKSYRKFQTGIKINDKSYSRKGAVVSVDGERIDGKPPVEDVPLDIFPDHIKSAVGKFTGKKGGTITRWSSTSLADKLSAIDSSKIINISLLMIALVELYDDASEMLHGTLYGCTMHFGLYDPNFKPDMRTGKTSADSMNKQFRKTLSFYYLILNQLIHQFCQAISKKTNFDKYDGEMDEIHRELR